MFKKKMFFSSARRLLLGLMAGYKFENNVNDVIGMNNGTTVNSPTYVSGISGNAIDFGNDDEIRYATIPDASIFSFTNGVNDTPFSISTWAYFNSYSTTGNWLISKRRETSLGSGEWQFVRITATNEIAFIKYQHDNNNINRRIASPFPSMLNQWIHIVITFDGSTYKIYINKVSQTVTVSDTGSYIRMGNFSFPVVMGALAVTGTINPTTKHRGRMDETYFYNRALNQSEVDELYTKFYPF